MLPPFIRLIFASLITVLCVTAGYGKDESPPKSKDEKKPPIIHSATEIENAIDRGVAFLLKDQNTNGSWGSPHNTKGLNIYAPNPAASHKAYRGAVTAMCVTALIESGHADKSPEAKQTLERGETWLMEELPKIRRATAGVMVQRLGTRLWYSGPCSFAPTSSRCWRNR